MRKIRKYYSIGEEISKPLGRLLVAQVFLILGYRKIIYYDETAGWMESMGISGSFLPLVIVVDSWQSWLDTGLENSSVCYFTLWLLLFNCCAVSYEFFRSNAANFFYEKYSFVWGAFIYFCPWSR
mgnify:CR=1 FL=1